MEAWREKGENCRIKTFVGDESLEIPIPQDHNDEAVLRRIRMFYNMIQMASGIPGLLLPKQLNSIERVEVSKPLLVGAHADTRD